MTARRLASSWASRPLNNGIDFNAAKSSGRGVSAAPPAPLLASVAFATPVEGSKVITFASLSWRHARAGPTSERTASRPSPIHGRFGSDLGPGLAAVQIEVE